MRRKTGRFPVKIRFVWALLLAFAMVAAGCTVSQSPLPDTTTTRQPADVPVADELTLHTEGIGPYEVGDEAEFVIAGITNAIGGWDADSSDEASPVQLPECGDASSRVVSWGSLALVFVRGYARETFVSWSFGFDPVSGNSDDLRGLGLRTEAGIGLGATRQELEDAYRAGLEITNQPAIDSAIFAIDKAQEPHLSGKLDSSGPQGIVDLIQIEPTC
ncbi:MAG: hypothetical protein BMS9Abin17_0117 [Acidimicrobiia bacterium]|nr:MAG: hypothetical protein BMS9Abin17_0117 [Acidimicrobiia bacterium]